MTTKKLRRKRPAQNNAKTGARRKTPTGRPFPKGTSGNPGGRPRIPKHVIELARAATEDAIAALVTALKCRDVNARIRAAKALLDRGWGRAPQMHVATVVDDPTEKPVGLSDEAVELIKYRIFGMEPPKPTIELVEPKDDRRDPAS